MWFNICHPHSCRILLSKTCSFQSFRVLVFTHSNCSNTPHYLITCYDVLLYTSYEKSQKEHLMVAWWVVPGVLGSGRITYCWASPAKQFFVPSSAELMTTFFCLTTLGVVETAFLVALIIACCYMYSADDRLHNLQQMPTCRGRPKLVLETYTLLMKHRSKVAEK
jgi:hypothetical protein